MLKVLHLIIVALVILSSSCQRPPPDCFKKEESDPQKIQKPARLKPKKKTGRLKIGDMVYIDRNCDGIVDYEKKDDGMADTIIYYKIDDDFDGYYDRMGRSGGFSGRTREKQIEEKVSPVRGLIYR